MDADLGDVLVDALTGGPFRTGDHVRHRPTGEDWVVGWHDPISDDLAWCGWPPGIGKGSDCTLIKAATDFECHSLINQLPGENHRRAFDLHWFTPLTPEKE